METLERPQLELISEDEVNVQPKTVVTLSKFQISDMWEQGLLNPATYIMLAFLYEQEEQPFDGRNGLDIENFIFEWRGTVDEKGKAKELTRQQVLNTIAKLESLGFLNSHVREVKITLNG